MKSLEEIRVLVEQVAQDGGEKCIFALRDALEDSPWMIREAMSIAIPLIQHAGPQDYVGEVARAFLSVSGLGFFDLLHIANQIENALSGDSKTIMAQKEGNPALILAVASSGALPPAVQTKLRSVLEENPQEAKPAELRLAMSRSKSLPLAIKALVNTQSSPDALPLRPATLCAFRGNEELQQKIRTLRNCGSANYSHAFLRKNAIASGDRRSRRAALALVIASEALLANREDLLAFCASEGFLLENLAHESFQEVDRAERTRFAILFNALKKRKAKSMLEIRPLPNDLNPANRSELATSATIRNYLRECAHHRSVPDLDGISLRLDQAMESNPDLKHCIDDYQGLFTVTPRKQSLRMQRWRTLIQERFPSRHEPEQPRLP